MTTSDINQKLAKARFLDKNNNVILEFNSPIITCISAESDVNYAIAVANNKTTAFASNRKLKVEFEAPVMDIYEQPAPRTLIETASSNSKSDYKFFDIDLPLESFLDF